MAKNPQKHLTDIQDRQADHLDTQVTNRAQFNQDFLQFWLPSGTTAKVPKHEVLTLRDLCNSWMAQNGALDLSGREVDWQRPHPAEPAPQTSDTEPSSTGPQDAA